MNPIRKNKLEFYRGSPEDALICDNIRIIKRYLDTGTFLIFFKIQP